MCIIHFIPLITIIITFTLPIVGVKRFPTILPLLFSRSLFVFVSQKLMVSFWENHHIYTYNPCNLSWRVQKFILRSAGQEKFVKLVATNKQAAQESGFFFPPLNKLLFDCTPQTFAIANPVFRMRLFLSFKPLLVETYHLVLYEVAFVVVVVVVADAFVVVLQQGSLVVYLKHYKINDWPPLSVFVPVDAKTRISSSVSSLSTRLDRHE